MDSITIIELAEMLNEQIPEGKTFSSTEEIKQFVDLSLETKLSLSKSQLENQLKKSKLELNILLPDLERARTDLEESKKLYHEQLNSYKLESILEKEKSKIQFKSDISELEKVGFQKIIEEQFLFQLNENGGVDILDSKRKPIHFSGKTKPASVEEVFLKLAEDNKLLAPPSSSRVVVQAHSGRVLHPKAMRG